MNMKIITTALSLTTILCLSTLGEAVKCDESIVRMIRHKFWNNCNCVPRELLRSGAYTSPGITKRTTKNFYADEDQISCAYSVFEGSLVKLYTQYLNSTTVVGPKIFTDNVEEDGALIDKARGVYRYYLYGDKLGVRALYRCSKTGKSGDPEGLIKVTASGYDEESYIQAIKDLASLGINVSDKLYGDSCVP